MKKVKKDKFFRITSLATLARIEELLKEYDLYTLYKDDYFLLFGFKTLSSKAKDTYKVIRNLTNLKDPNIDLSLDYLASVFSTTEAAQSQRIQQLVDHGLIKVAHRAYNLNKYTVVETFADSTFVHTVIRLIRRKRLGQLCYKHISSNSITEKVSLLQKITKSVNKGARHFKARSIIGNA